MNDLLSKISSYHLFNYLLPGVLFTALADDGLRSKITQKDLISTAFVCYFIGLVISRFGSLVIEPLLKWTKFIEFAEYRDFVSASKQDALVNVLSESNNTYRTLSSLFIVLLLLKGYAIIGTHLPQIKPWNSLLLTLLLLVMFLFSYRKQTSYVSKRVKAASGD